MYDDTLSLPQQRQQPANHWLAGRLRAWAHRLERRKSPAYSELVNEKLAAVRVALLDAEAEQERWQNTVRMLRQRVVRLSKES